MSGSDSFLALSLILALTPVFLALALTSALVPPVLVLFPPPALVLGFGLTLNVYLVPALLLAPDLPPTLALVC